MLLPITVRRKKMARMEGMALLRGVFVCVWAAAVLTAARRSQALSTLRRRLRYSRCVAMESLKRCCLGPACEVTSCCFCIPLRIAVILISVGHLINASMCFAGEAALFFGLGTVVIEQSAGSYLPGTKITDPRIQGFIIVSCALLCSS